MVRYRRSSGVPRFLCCRSGIAMSTGSWVLNFCLRYLTHFSRCFRAFLGFSLVFFFKFARCWILWSGWQSWQCFLIARFRSWSGKESNAALQRGQDHACWSCGNSCETSKIVILGRAIESVGFSGWRDFQWCHLLRMTEFKLHFLTGGSPPIFFTYIFWPPLPNMSLRGWGYDRSIATFKLGLAFWANPNLALMQHFNGFFSCPSF